MMDFILLALLAIVLALCLPLLLFQAITGAPPHSATRAEAATVVALLREAGLPEQAVVCDLGSGWGSMVVALAWASRACIVGLGGAALYRWPARGANSQPPRRVASDVP